MIHHARPSLGWSVRGNGGEGWIRTSVRLRGQIYSLLPLTTRPPLHEEFPVTWAGAPNGGASFACQRALRNGVPVALRCRSGASKNQNAPCISIFGAGEGNRTLVISLEGFCSTIELHPPGSEPRRHAIWLMVASTAAPSLDGRQVPALTRASHDEPGRHRRNLDRSPLVARDPRCGAMARLID